MSKTKVYAIVGFLGSGKTTFLKNLPETLASSKVAVVINEFGNKDLDGLILKDHFSMLSEISGGSIFCSCRTDQFVSVVATLSKQDFDYIFIEGSGLANPGNIKKVIYLIDKESNHQIDFRGVIGIVDPTSIYKVITTLNAAKNQIIYSDVILINKADIATSEELLNAIKLVKEQNPDAPIFETTYSTIPFFLIDELISFHDQRKGSTILDIHIQEMSFHFPEVSREQLKRICISCERYVDRIKGVVNLDGSTYFFEYVNQKLVYTSIKSKAENFIVFLSTSKENIKSNIQTEVRKIIEWVIE